MKYVSIHFTEEQHRTLKILAAKDGRTLQKFCFKAVEEFMKAVLRDNKELYKEIV